MNWLDYTFLGVIGLSVVIGVIRGFVREVISVIVWVTAFWLAARYGVQVGEQFSAWLTSPMLQMVAGFATVFVVILIGGTLVGYLARMIVGQTGLGGTDRLLGVVFGGLRGGLLVGLVVLGAGFTALPQQAWWQGSIIASGYQPWVCHDRVGHWLTRAREVPGIEQAPMDTTAAFAHWQAYCQRPTQTDNGS
jgi:membrane protein required for colicin V production